MRLLTSLASVMLVLGAPLIAAPDQKPIAESSPAVTGDAILPQNPEIPWLATATFGWGLDSDMSTWQGGGEILVPIVQGEDSLFFLNAWTGFYQRDEHFFSLGAGYRWLNPSETVFLGINAFWDHGEIDNFASFDRLGLGLELSTRLLDIRLNGYLAEDDRYAADSAAVLSYGSLFAQGNSVFQALTVPGAEAFSGGEIEIGRQLPLSEEFPVAVGIWGGAYSVSGPEDDSKDLNGWRIRAEIALSEKLFLDAAYYDDEEFVGGNSYIGLRASIPLGPGSNEVIDDSIIENYLRAKLGQRVVRQHRLIHSTTVTENAKIADDLIFVNRGSAQSNGIGRGTSKGKGTAEKPFRSLDDGSQKAASQHKNTDRTWSVYAQGGSFVYREDVEVSRSANFTSSAVPIIGLDGQRFGTGHVPVLDGGFLSRGAGTVGIAGYRITGGARHSLSSRSRVAGIPRGRGNGVYFEGVSDFVLANSLIDDTESSGVVLVGRKGTPTRFKVTNSVIEDSDGHGLAVYGRAGWVGQGTVSGNILKNNAGDGLHLESAAATFNGEVSDNLARGNGGDGFDLGAHDTGVLNLLLARNTAESNANGYRLSSTRARVNAEVLSNTARSNREDGFRFEYPDGLVSSTISGNLAVSNHGDGFEFENDNGTFLGLISGNTALTNGVEGFLFDLATGSQLRADIIDNLAVGNLGSGFRIFVPRGGFFGDIRNNQAWANGQHGFAIDASGTRIIGDIEGNTASENLLDGFNFFLTGGTLIGNIIRNTSTLNGGDGFHIELNGGTIDGRIAYNFAAFNSGDGFQIESILGSITDGIFDNVAFRNRGSGFSLIFDAFDTTFAGNEARRNGGHGFAFSTIDDIAPTGFILDNFAGHNGLSGFEFQIGDDLSGTIDGNHAAGNGGSGFHLVTRDDFQTDGIFTNNFSEGNRGAGFELEIGEDFEGVFIRNTARGNTGDGIKIGIVNDLDGGGPAGLGLIAGNIATGNLGTGINIIVGDDLIAGGRIVSNTASGNGADGINIFVAEITDANRPAPNNIRLNIANGNGRNGIVFTGGNFFLTSRFALNTANANGANGIVFILDPLGLGGLNDDIADGSRFLGNTTIGNVLFGVVSSVDEQGPLPFGANDTGNVQAGNGSGDRSVIGVDDLGNNVNEAP
ncbi:MAG: hypothetical protein ACI8UO_005859 [Verrucomicrobiales bacterium]|jgi:hypothetical protein